MHEGCVQYFRFHSASHSKKSPQNDEKSNYIKGNNYCKSRLTAYKVQVILFTQKLFTTTVFLILNCELKILRTIPTLLRGNYLRKIRKYIRDTAAYLVYHLHCIRAV